MRRFLVDYSVCDFETQKEFRAENVFEAEKRFLRLVVDLGGLEKGDIDYYQFTELPSESN
jgi:hypothetical protein